MEFRCSIRQLIRLGLAVGLLAACLAPGPAHAQGPQGSQGVWQTFTTANSGLRDDRVTALLEDRAGGVWVGTAGGGVSRYFEGTWQAFFMESDSLSDNIVIALLEDRVGGVWVGTTGGVSRYFEGTWQTFSTESDSLGSNHVTGLLEDQAGGIWVSTAPGWDLNAQKYVSGGGVSRYSEGAWQTFSLETGDLGSNDVTALLEDRTGGVWVGTATERDGEKYVGGGVNRYFEGTWQAFSAESGSLSSNDVTALLEDRTGGVWVGTGGGGVSRYLEGTWQTFSVESGSLGNNDVRALLEDRAGGLWVGTGGGVSRYFKGIWQTFSTKTGSLGHNGVTALLEDRAGGAWVGTVDGGVSRYFQGAWQTFSVESGSLGHNYVVALLEDRAGGVWVGTGGGGVSRYFHTWQTFSAESGSLGNNDVRALLEDRDGGVWVGTTGGVSRYFEGTWQTFSIETSSLGYNSVTALLEDQDGGLWIGTSHGGVSHYFQGTWQTFSLETGDLGSNDVIVLLEDRAGGLWVGTAADPVGDGGGVSRYFQGAWQIFSVENDSLGNNGVTRLLEDRAGGVWVGTNGGVSRYFEGAWQTFSAETGSLGSNAVWALLEDRADGLWVGTYGGGASRYFQGTWQTFSTETGSLGHNIIEALLEDQAGGVWVSTYGGGVSRYFQGTWQIFSVETGSLSHNWTTVLLEDQAGGVWVGTGDPFGGGGGVNRYFQGAWQTFSTETGSLGDNWVTELLEDRAGGVWVGTYGGVSYHRPGSYQPWVLLCQLEVEQKRKTQSYNLSGEDVPEVALDFPVERLAIHFIGADLDSHPDNIRYFYQLEGRDAKRRPTVEGLAQYENLPPGRYTFVVQSLDEDLTFSPEARLAIIIPVPFWRTEWFWGGVGLLAVGAVVGTVVGGRRWRRARRLADWRAGHDPYIVGDVVEEPEKFYGREEALAALLRALEAGNHVALYGERRIGKTSLLYQLAHRLREKGDAPGAYLYLPVFVNLQMVPEARFFYALTRTIAGVARPYLDDRGQPLPSLLADERSAGYDSLDMADDLERVLEFLHKVTDRPVRIVLLLDEADKMNGYDPHTQEGLRGLLMTPLGRQVKLVWSGQTMNREWHLETSPWFNLLKHEINLVGLEDEAAVRLVRQPVKGVFTYDDEAVARILRYSDRQPYTIQRLCSFCVRQLLAKDRFRVTVEDVETAYQAMQAEDARRAAEEVAPQAVYAPQAPVQSLAEDQDEYKADESRPEEEE
jgi:ligand-binding sensor domain-containing protein